MKYYIRDVVDDDESSIRDIFNHYIEGSYAAFPEEKVGPGFFSMMN